MILTLQVVGERAQDLGAASRKVFKGIGGTIGRLPDNDWVFPDPYVSGRHALIRYVNGTYFIEDTSTNGVFVNSLESRLAKGQAHALRDGDRLYIDAYEIEVLIKEDPARKSRHDPFADPRTTSTGDVTLFKGDRTASLAATELEPFDDLEDEEVANETEWFAAQDMRSKSPSIRPALEPAPIANVGSRPITRKPASNATVAQGAPKSSTSAANCAGSWSGSGSVQFEGGQSERLRCTAYYTSGGGGNELGLAIRCASASNKIELRGRLTYADGNVSGTWEERTYNATGTASGKANSGNVALRLAGAIPGTMNLTFSKARQSVAISTQGSKVKAVNIGLSRR